MIVISGASFTIIRLMAGYAHAAGYRCENHALLMLQVVGHVGVNSESTDTVLSYRLQSPEGATYRRTS